MSRDERQKRRAQERPTGQRQRQRRKSSGIGRIAIEILIVVFVVVAVGKVAKFGFDYAKGLTSSTVEGSAGTGEPVSVTIPEGASTSTIASILKENDLISNELMFRLKSKLGGYDGTYRHGDYTLQKGLDDETIMERLQEGSTAADQIVLTIPEGYTVQQIAEVVENAGISTAEEFLQEANNGDFDYGFLKDLPTREYYLEGYLFPETYYFSKNATARDVIIRMLDQFSLVYTDEMQQAVTNSGYSLDQIITMASIIESEIQVPEEQKIAAGVINNRLEQNMPLQMDATVLYALKTKHEVVTNADVEVDSPYNTYKNTGLPIGPICNPGSAAIEAAVFPDDNDYLYYVLKERGSGEHFYTSSYEEFLKAKEQYKASFNNR